MAKILVADDDAHIVRVMSIWLERHGHDVLHASNGEDALSIVESTEVELLITDMNMPVLDGIELAKRVRKNLKRAIPIVMLTARCDQEALNEKLSDCDVKVFPKPFVPSQLMVVIDRLLNPVTQ